MYLSGPASFLSSLCPFPVPTHGHCGKYRLAEHVNVIRYCRVSGIFTPRAGFLNSSLVRTLHRLARRLARWLVDRIDLLGGGLPEGSPVRSLGYSASGGHLWAATDKCRPDYKYLSKVLPEPLEVPPHFGTLRPGAASTSGQLSASLSNVFLCVHDICHLFSNHKNF